MRLRYRTGVMRDGKVTGVDAKILIDGGAYSSFGLVTTYYSGQLLTAPYRLPAYRFDSTRVFTNKPCCGPKRGHGSVQPRFAFECQIDKLAEVVGLDPIELRRRNLLGEHTTTVNGMRITSNGFPQCLDAVERASEWASKFRRLPYGRGVGVAGSMGLRPRRGFARPGRGVLYARCRAPDDERARGVPARRGALRHAGNRGLVPEPQARRRLPRRHDRGVAGVFVHGARRRGRVRR